MWAVFRYIRPTYICMARFSSRAKAEVYFKLLRDLLPNARLELMFEDNYDYRNS